MSGQFISLGRMRRAKFEEALTNRQLKTEFGGIKHVVTHTNCSCGSMECLAVPTINSEKKPLTASEAKRDLKQSRNKTRLRQLAKKRVMAGAQKKFAQRTERILQDTTIHNPEVFIFKAR